MGRRNTGYRASRVFSLRSEYSRLYWRVFGENGLLDTTPLVVRNGDLYAINRDGLADAVLKLLESGGRE